MSHYTNYALPKRSQSVVVISNKRRQRYLSIFLPVLSDVCKYRILDKNVHTFHGAKTKHLWPTGSGNHAEFMSTGI